MFMQSQIYEPRLNHWLSIISLVSSEHIKGMSVSAYMYFNNESNDWEQKQTIVSHSNVSLVKAHAATRITTHEKKTTRASDDAVRAFSSPYCGSDKLCPGWPRTP